MQCSCHVKPVRTVQNVRENVSQVLTLSSWEGIFMPLQLSVSSVKFNLFDTVRHMMIDGSKMHPNFKLKGSKSGTHPATIKDVLCRCPGKISLYSACQFFPKVFACYNDFEQFHLPKRVQYEAKPNASHTEAANWLPQWGSSIRDGSTLSLSCIVRLAAAQALVCYDVEWNSGLFTAVVARDPHQLRQ